MVKSSQKIFSPLFAPTPLLLATGFSLLSLFFLMNNLPKRWEAHPEAYVPLFLTTFLLYLWVVFSFLILYEPNSGLLKPFHLYLILGFALLFRLTLLSQPPTLSTDILRYLWDGHVAEKGRINPYQFAPSEVPPSLRTPYWKTINHPTWVTMYPPFSQTLFKFFHWLGGCNILLFKSAFTLAEVGGLLLLLLIFKQASLSPFYLLIYAWHPLVIIEIAGAGHQDALGIFFFLLTIYFLGLPPRESNLLSLKGHLLGGIAAGLSIMSKGYLLPALPLCARNRPLPFLFAFGTTSILLTLPYLTPGNQILKGLTTYLQNRLRNAGLLAWMTEALRPYSAEPLFLAKSLCFLFLLIAIFWLAWHPWQDISDLMKRLQRAMGLFLLLGHTVYPWYGTWLIPTLCFHLSPGFLIWTGLISLAYLNPVPHRNPWVLTAEYLPVLLLLLLEGWQERGKILFRGKKKEEPERKS